MLIKLFNNNTDIGESRLVFLQGRAYVQAAAARRSKARAAKAKKAKKAGVVNMNKSNTGGRTTIAPGVGKPNTVNKSKQQHYNRGSRTPIKDNLKKISKRTPKASSNSVFNLNANSVYKPSTNNRLNFGNAKKYDDNSKLEFGSKLAKTIEDRDKSGANKNLWSIDRFNKTATPEQKKELNDTYNKINKDGHVSNFNYNKSLSVFDKLKNLANKPSDNKETFSIKPSEPKDEKKVDELINYGGIKIGGNDADVNTVDVVNELKNGKSNPFQKGTKEYDMYNKLKGMMVYDQELADEQIENLKEQKEAGIGLINDSFNLKDQMLEEQGTEANRDKEAETKLARDRMMFGSVNLEEGRKRAMRYLKGALAQRGAYGTTGTGKYNMSYLMSQYDIKDSDLKQKANEQISNVEKQFHTIQRKINDSKLINENDKRRLLYELEKETTNAVSNVMTNLRNVQRGIETKAFDLGYGEQLREDQRTRDKQKELRDYIIKLKESGEYVSQDLVDKAVNGDPIYDTLINQGTSEVGRENISTAITGVYEDMLGKDWATKTDPKTGRTFKDESTEEVVRLVNGGMKLEDALNRVRNSINNDPYFTLMKQYEMNKLKPKVGGSGSGSGDDDYKKDSWIKLSDGRTFRTSYKNGKPYYYDSDNEEFKIVPSDATWVKTNSYNDIIKSDIYNNNNNNNNNTNQGYGGVNISTNGTTTNNNTTNNNNTTTTNNNNDWNVY